MPTPQPKPLAQPPQMEEASLTAADLYDLFGAEEGFSYDETAAEGSLFSNQDVSYTEGSGAELKTCILRHCSLRGVRWKRASFTDVIFDHCDFSNARFSDAYFQRVQFIGCKLVGSDLVDALLRNVSFTDCLCRMFNLSGAKVTGVTFTRCDLNEAALRMLQEMKRFALTDCDLTRAELAGTKLKGLDLSSCNLSGIAVTGAPELRGAYVTTEQAVQLSSLLGILLKEQ